MTGSVYLLTNVSMPGLIKVGYTTRTVSQRIDELAHTGHPTRFFCELELVTDEPEILESNLHSVLYKFHYKKEFFKCDLVTAVKVIKEYLETTSLTVSYISGRAKDLYVTENEKIRIEQNQERLKREAKELEQSRIWQAIREKETEDYLSERETFYWSKFKATAHHFRSVIKLSIPIGESLWNSTPVLVTKIAFFPLTVLGGILSNKVVPSKTPHQLGTYRRKNLNINLLKHCDEFCRLRKRIVDENPEIYRRLYVRLIRESPREDYVHDLSVEGEYAAGLMGLEEKDPTILNGGLG